MEDAHMVSFWYAYEGAILIILMNAAHAATSMHHPVGVEIESVTERVLFTDAAVCSICIAPHEPRGSVKLKCGHCYHLPCITRWLERANTCPVCRGNVEDG